MKKGGKKGGGRKWDKQNWKRTGRERKEKVKKREGRRWLGGVAEEGTEKKERERRNTSSKMADEETEHTEGQNWRPKELSEKTGYMLSFTNTKRPSLVIPLYFSHSKTLRPFIVSACNQATCHHSVNKRGLFLTALAAFTAKACIGTRDHPHDITVRIYSCCEQQQNSTSLMVWNAMLKSGLCS